jgi:transposase
MPRRSQWLHLKPDIFRLFENGATFKEVAERFPDMPEGTIKTWKREFHRRLDDALDHGDLNPNQISDIIVAEVCPEEEPVRPKLVSLPSAEESDYQLARRTARRLLRDESVNPHTKVMAIGALARLIEMRYSLPAHILEETTQSNAHTERDRLRDLDAAELARRYREAL